MTVLMTMRINGDAAALQKLSADDPKAFPAVLEKARDHGAISHHFYSAPGQILVIDEWPDEASYQAFFAASPEIGGFMQGVGVTGQPEITFWNKMDLGDDLG